MTEWYYSKMGLQQGPVPEDELLQKIRRGEISGATLVWREGMGEWIPASQVPELMDSPVSNQQAAEELSQFQPLPPPVTAAVTASTVGNVPLPQPPAYHGNYIAPLISNYMWQSVVATVIGIPFCCILAMPFGIVAIVFAAKVEGLRVSGDVMGATRASNSAKTWMIVSFATSGIGLLLNIANLVLRQT